MKTLLGINCTKIFQVKGDNCSKYIGSLGGGGGCVSNNVPQNESCKKCNRETARMTYRKDISRMKIKILYEFSLLVKQPMKTSVLLC